MADQNNITVTDKNLDRLASFLTQELEQPRLAGQIPDGAHIFHGLYNDLEFTRTNLNLATNLLLGMALGLRNEAPLVMLFEDRSGHLTVIPLSTPEHRRKAHEAAKLFQQQHRQEMWSEIDQLLAA